MDQNYKKEYYYNNRVLTAIDNNHAVLVIYIENLNNKSDAYCAPIAYLSNNCWLLYTSKHCNVIENHIFWCNDPKRSDQNKRDNLDKKSIKNETKNW
jgi:hypothetical protein